MNRLYSVFLFPILWVASGIDCQTDFECKTVAGSAKAGQTLELKLSEGLSEEYSFELYDLNTGKLISKKKAFFSSGEAKMIFDKIKPSTYTVYFSSASCAKKKAVKGKGIVVE